MVPIVANDIILPYDNRPRPDYEPFKETPSLEFLVEFDEIEDWVNEVKTQLADIGVHSVEFFVM